MLIVYRVGLVTDAITSFFQPDHLGFAEAEVQGPLLLCVVCVGLDERLGLV